MSEDTIPYNASKGMSKLLEDPKVVSDMAISADSLEAVLLQMQREVCKKGDMDTVAHDIMAIKRIADLSQLFKNKYETQQSKTDARS